jgi:hypothetical protein
VKLRRKIFLEACGDRVRKSLIMNNVIRFWKRIYVGWIYATVG